MIKVFLFIFNLNCLTHFLNLSYVKYSKELGFFDFETFFGNKVAKFSYKILGEKWHKQVIF